MAKLKFIIPASLVLLALSTFLGIHRHGQAGQRSPGNSAPADAINATGGLTASRGALPAGSASRSIAHAPGGAPDATPPKSAEASLTGGLKLDSARLEANAAKLVRFLLLKQTGELVGPIERQTLDQLLATSPEAALRWAVRQDAGEEYGRLYVAAINAWAARDLGAAWSWASTQTDMTAALAVLTAAEDRLAAASLGADWVEQSREENLPRYILLSRLWRELGQTEANLVLADGLGSDLREVMFQTALTEYTQANPSEAFKYARMKESASARESALVAVVAGWPSDKLDALRDLLPDLARSPAAKALADHQLGGQTAGGR